MSILNHNPPGSPTALGNISCIDVPSSIYDKVHDGKEKFIIHAHDITSKYISIGRENDKRSTLLLFAVKNSEKITKQDAIGVSGYTRAILDKYYAGLDDLFLVSFTGI